MSKTDSDALTLLDEVQAIARTGLHYAPTWYDRERYARLLELATGSYAALLEMPAAEIRERFRQEVGCMTPKVGADAAIFNERGEILLMDRADGSGWCLPCGWVEPHEQPAQTAVREAREETGLDIEVRHLVGVFTRPASLQNGPHSMIAVVHLCAVVGGELSLSPEGKTLQFRAIDNVRHWHANHETYARAAHAMWAAGRVIPAVSM